MKAIDFLRKIKKIDANINFYIEELEKLNALATRTTSVMGGERVQTSGSQQKMADCVVNIVEKQEQLANEVNRLESYKETARQLLLECDAECLTVLNKRYFQYKSWEEIAVEMKFTYQWVSGGLHRKALAQFQKALDERKTDRCKQ